MRPRGLGEVMSGKAKSEQSIPGLGTTLMEQHPAASLRN